MHRPVEDGFFMPAEWAPHKRCWMAWPCRAQVWGEHLDAAREAYAEVARTIAEFEPVTMIANPEDVAEVSLRCGSQVGALPLGLDDSWARDIGPSFLVDGKGGLAGVDWRFNAWGGKYDDYEKDADLARALLDRLEVPRYEAPMVLEGGSIHVDGEGTLLTSEQCLLNPNRNPKMTPKEIESCLGDYLGARTVVWLGQGLVDDETDGHVDNLACFVKPGVVLALTTQDSGDANFTALQDNLARLRAARDAKGRELEVVEIEQPAAAAGDDGRRLSRSYINFYIANGGIVMPSFEDPKDTAAFATVSKCFPDRAVRQVPAGSIVLGGGGIHCITQQEPSPTGEPPGN
jgi:agmatine deiminase